MTPTTPSNRAPYTIHIDRSAEKTLRKQPRTVAARLIKAIFALADDPHPPSSRKLEGYDFLNRLRVGDWRVIYQIIDAELVILVLDIGSRGDIYRSY